MTEDQPARKKRKPRKPVNVLMPTGLEADILLGLAKYRFLSARHILRLRGTTTDRDTRGALRGLETARLVKRQDSGPIPGHGRLPSCFWLTKRGAEVASGLLDGEAVGFPETASISLPHLPHRYLVLDTLIELDLWANMTGQEILRRGSFFTTASTALKNLHIKADGLAVVRGQDGKARPYLVEASRGEYGGGVNHGLRTVSHYLDALSGNLLDAAVRGDEDFTAARVLFVYDSPAVRDSVMRRLEANVGLPEHGHAAWKRLHFKAAAELLYFPSAWHAVHGGQGDLPNGLGNS